MNFSALSADCKAVRSDILAVPVGAFHGLTFPLFPVPIVNFLLSSLFVDEGNTLPVFIKDVNLFGLCSPFAIFSEGGA